MAGSWLAVDRAATAGGAEQGGRGSPQPAAKRSFCSPRQLRKSMLGLVLFGGGGFFVCLFSFLTLAGRFS